MASINRILKPRKQLISTLIIVLSVSIATAFIMVGAFSTKEGEDWYKALASVFGTALSYLSVIVAAYHLIAKSNYEKRIKELEEYEDVKRLEKEIRESEAVSKEQLDEAKKKFAKAQEIVYAEFKYYLAFDETAAAHVYLSIAMVAFGGAFLIYSAI